MTFAAGEGMWKPISGVEQDLADKILKGSFDAGVNFVDTADVYTNGESEKTLAKAISNVGIARKDIVIATKVFGRTGPAGTMSAPRAATLWTEWSSRSSVYRRTTSTFIRSTPPTPSRPSKRRCAPSRRLVSHGKVRYIGCSNWYAWQLMQALGYCRGEEPGQDG